MMVVKSGEVRFMAIDLANDPGVVAEATLGEITSLVVLTKRGEEEVAVVLEDPAPAVVGTQVRFWGDFEGIAAGRYIVRAEVTLSNDEVAIGETVLVVE